MDMERHIADMGNILKKETTLFEKIFGLEQNKTNAIIEHNGKLIEKISMEQEELLTAVSALEIERMKNVDAYKREMRIRRELTTLTDITDTLKGTSGRNMAALGRELKDVMTRLSRVRDTNKVLINDNMQYYNILLTGLRRDPSLDTGYGHDGKEEENLRSSILINTTV